MFALQVMDLGPLHRACTVDVVEADVKHTGIEAFDLAGKAIAVVHHNHVGLVSSEERRT
ncbi:MAG: hypothetical protein WA830_02415 [Candidatus Sulfotelmatobacter sp.]